MDESLLSQQAKDIPSRRNTSKYIILALVAGAIVSLALFAHLFIAPPANFPTNTVITITPGSDFSSISSEFSSQGLVRSQNALLAIAKITHVDRSVVAGPYLFTEPLSVFGILSRLVRGTHGIQEVSITIPEGFDRRKMADTAATLLPNFDPELFLILSEEDEGYLFPDTYSFFQTATSGDVYHRLRERFIEKTAQLQERVRKDGKSFRDIVTLASIIEREVIETEDRRIVAGIFYRRMDIGMPLQADATFVYEIGKGSSELSIEDLQRDSLYNTYTRRGLPPTPISSPGMDALLAAYLPQETPYLYYLSGKDGVTYFAKTFEEHKLNKARYLR